MMRSLEDRLGAVAFRLDRKGWLYVRGLELERADVVRREISERNFYNKNFLTMMCGVLLYVFIAMNTSVWIGRSIPVDHDQYTTDAIWGYLILSPFAIWLSVWWGRVYRRQLMDWMRELEVLPGRCLLCKGALSESGDGVCTGCGAVYGPKGLDEAWYVYPMVRRAGVMLREVSKEERKVLERRTGKYLRKNWRGRLLIWGHVLVMVPMTLFVAGLGVYVGGSLDVPSRVVMVGLGLLMIGGVVGCSAWYFVLKYRLLALGEAVEAMRVEGIEIEPGICLRCGEQVRVRGGMGCLECGDGIVGGGRGDL